MAFSAHGVDMFAFLQANARWIGGGFLLTFCSSFGQTFFISASIAEWQAAFDLSHGQFGGLYLIATMASALTLPFLGKVVDTAPEHRVILFTMPILAFASVLAAFAPSLLVLTVAIYLLRLFGQGMMTHIAFTATGRWFAASRGRAVSLVTLGHQGGEALLPLTFALIGASLGWQAGWIVGAAFLLLAALPMAILAYRVPRTPQGQRDEAETAIRHWTRAEVLRDPVFWMLLIGVLASPFIGTITFFHQDYLTDLHGWPPTLFATSLSVMAGTTVVVALITGALVDRFGSRRILPFFLLPLTVSAFGMAFATSAAALFGAMIALGISYGVTSTLFGALWPEAYGTRHLGAIRSSIVAAMVLSTAIGPGLTGALIDAGIALPTQFLFFGGYCLAATALMSVAAYCLKARESAGG